MNIWPTPFDRLQNHTTAIVAKKRVFGCSGCRLVLWSFFALPLPTLVIGCSQSTPPPAPTALGQVQAQNWDRALGQMWNSWQNTAKSSASPSPKSTAASLPLVFIDLSTLASHHPAWELAQSLEENRHLAIDFAALHAAGIRWQHMSTPSFDIDLDREQGVSTEVSGTAALDDANEDTPQNSELSNDANTRDLEALAVQVGDRQSDEMEQFLLSVGARQTDARQQYAQIRRVALENQVEAVRATPLPELKPSLLTDAEQLQVTNLQLKLLGNVFVTTEERTRAQAQLDKILVDWQARLKAQEQARVAELQQRIVDEPQHTRASGEAAIRLDLARLRHEQRAALEQIWQQHQARVHQDFGQDTATFAMTLPPAAQVQRGNLPDAPVDRLPDKIRTKLPPLASLAPFVSPFASRGIATNTTAPRFSPTSTERSEIIRALRVQAWRAAQQEAQWAARRFGWRWQAAPRNGDNVPDRTQEVLRWLAHGQ